MGPIRMWHALRDYQKFEGILKETTSMKTKVIQIAALLVTGISTFGVAKYCTNWVDHNTIAYAGLGIAAQLLHALFPSIFAKPVSKLSNRLPLAILFAALLVLPMNAKAQGLPNAPSPQATAPQLPVQPETQAIAGPVNFYAFGVSYNVNAKPAIAGTAMYCHNLDPKHQLSTYACTVFDAVPNTIKPLTVSTNIGAGIAQDIAHFGKVTIWTPAAAGFSWNGKSSGWEWNGGVAATIPTGKRLYLVPNVRFLKSSVSNGSGYQVIAGFDVGFGG